MRGTDQQVGTDYKGKQQPSGGYQDSTESARG